MGASLSGQSKFKSIPLSITRCYPFRQTLSTGDFCLPTPSFLNHPGTKRGLGLSRVPKKSGLGESLGKTSLANTSFGSRRLFPSHGGPPSREELVPHSSKTWPDEALEKGLPRPFAKKKEKLGEGKVTSVMASIGLRTARWGKVSRRQGLRPKDHQESPDSISNGHC